MKRIRKWIVTAGIVLALMLPLAMVASADPGDLGGGCGSCFTSGSIVTTPPSKNGK